MFNMLNEGFNKKFLYESQLEPIEKEIKRVLKNADYNVDSEGADNYIKAAAEYVDYSRTVGGDTNYSVKQWLADTESNYPDDLSFMKESLTEADEVEDNDINQDDVDNAFIDDISFDDVDDEQSLNYDDSEDEIDIDDEIETDKKPIDDKSKPDNLGTFHNDNGNDYKVIERSESGKNALLQRGKQWVIAYNCPESNEGSWGQGHYFFDEEEARKVWEDKYLNESLDEDTIKQNGKWVNKGKEGTHGKFNTKKAADAQRKAMFAQGYKAEALRESISIRQVVDNCLLKLSTNSTLDEIKEVVSSELVKQFNVVRGSDYKEVFDDVILRLAGKNGPFIRPVNESPDKDFEDKNSALKEAYYKDVDEETEMEWQAADLDYDYDRTGVYVFNNAKQADIALKAAKAHGWRDAWRETNIVYMAGNKIEESLKEDINDNNDYVSELKEKEEELINKIKDIQHRFHYRGYTQNWDYKYYIKQLNQIRKQIAEIEAKAKNEKVLSAANVTNAIKKISDLETLKTRTTAIRGYRPVTGGSFRVEPILDNGFQVYFYRDYDKIPAIVDELRKQGFRIKISDSNDSTFYVEKNKSLNLPKEESLDEGVMTGYWCPACHDKSLQSTLMVVDDKRQDGAEVLECDGCGKRFFRSKKDNKIKPLPEYVKVRRFDEAFDVNDRKAKSEVINWWKSVEKWNRENGSKYNIDNDYNDVEAMFTAMYDMFRELKNSNPELYKNGKSIYNKYATYPIKESKGNKPMKIIKEDYNQKLRESIRKIVFRLTEAEMSPEDKRDSDVLRNIYKKIDGRKIGKNTFTPEEQEVIDKYGLDVWGYRGDSKVVTNAGRKNVINSPEYKNNWGRPQQKFNKINYADRARKIDDRDYAQQINRRKGWNQTFDDAEKEMQGWKQSERINQMKRALKDRKYYQNEIDSAEDDLTNRLNRAESDADKKIADANKRMRDETSWARKSREAAQKSINDILDKHRVKECMNQLKEATSPEDEKDSDILRNIYYKMKNRSNAKLTPEEQEVVDKYNLVRTYNKNLKANDTDDYLFRRGENKNASWYDSDSFVNSKINYADRARKLGTRDYAQHINNMIHSGKTFRDKERTRINNELSKDVSDMKDALYNRKYNNERIANAEKDYQNKVAKIEAEKELAKERAKKYSSDNLERSRQKVADANTNIKKLLNKEESLKEDASEKRIVSTGLSGVKNEEILDSVIGQMSDGIWENSPGMEGYWIPADIDGCDIVIDNNQFIKYGANRYGDSKYIDNKYYRKSDDEVRRFFANKIKQITQEYLNDNNLNPYSDWRPDNDEVCDYLDRGSGVTVGDAYKAYKALK